MSEFEELQAKHRSLIAAQQSPSDFSSLAEKITQFFAMDEMRLLCFDLGLNYDELQGETKQAKAVSFIRTVERRGLYTELITELQKDRPGIKWSEKEPLEVSQVREFIEKVRQNSQYIASPQKRDQLRTILRYWSGYVYEKTGQYPNIELLPPLSEYSIPYRRKRAQAQLVIVALLLLTIFWGLWFLNIRELNESTSATATAVANESIRATETAVAAITLLPTSSSTPSPTRTPSPTPTTTPSLTPAPSETPTPGLTPTPDFSSISVRLLDPQNGAQVEPSIAVSGDYANLRPGWSIHILMQPVSQGGKLFPAESYYLVPNGQPSGTWEIEVQLGSGPNLQTPERYILETIVSTSDAGRTYLESVTETGIDELPTEFITFPQLTTVSRSAYDEINEVRIVYYAPDQATDSYEIYSMRTDGTDIRQITYTSDVGEIAPSLSPSGDKIAFIQLVPGETWEENVYSLWVMDSSGQNRALLVDDIKTEIYPAPVPVWSPDGKYIAFNRQVQNQSGTWAYHIMLYDTNSGEVRELTENSLSYTYPSWMPDSQTLVYRERFGIFSIDIITGETNAIFNDLVAVETQLSVSPDGTKIAMTYFVDTATTIGNRDIYVLETITGNLQRMTTHEGLDWMPTWHPDGTTIYFESHRETGHAGIWAIDADSTNERRISLPENIDSSPFVGLMRAYLPHNP